MFEFSLFAILFLAIVAGWYLGRYQRASNIKSLNLTASRDIKGLNYLLNDQPDTAIENFIQSLEVTSETFELHIALGIMLRNKGEVDRAIRIHQNLLSRPGLREELLQQANLELARDYLSAGLLDRAERLLDDPVQQSGMWREQSLRLLIEIYQQEKEWQQAIDTARQLQPRQLLSGRREPPSDPKLRQALAHYYCEIAEQRMLASDFRGVRLSLKQALAVDRDCVRVSLLNAEMELALKQPKRALKSLRRVKQQNPLLLAKSLPLVHQCFEMLGDNTGELALLQEWLAVSDSSSITLAVANILQQEQGAQVAISFLEQRLNESPSLRGLKHLIKAYIQWPQESSDSNSLALLQELVTRMDLRKPRFCCQSCGFPAQELIWLCPSCKQWGTIRPLRGIERD